MSDNTNEIKRKRVKSLVGTVGLGQPAGTGVSADKGVGTSSSASAPVAKKPANTVKKTSKKEPVERRKAAPVSKPVKAPQVGKTGQYIGICLLMFAIVLIIPIVSQTGQEFISENVLMTLAIGICIVLTTAGYLNIAIVACASSIVMFAAFKLYYKLVLHSDFYFISYLWIIIPIIALAGAGMFASGYQALKLENALLKKQVSDLVMIDPVTGLYNLRSMFMDIQTQISYSERNDIPVSLMIIRLRYPNEMRKVLKTEEYNKAIKQLSLLLVDTVRLEDRVYSIDDMGGFGIILTCGHEGTKIVEKRMREKLKDPSWFQNVSTKHQIRAEVRIGYLQYDKEKYNRNAESFKNSVEEEASYDI